jgi:osmotically-inducible protein OsmY
LANSDFDVKAVRGHVTVTGIVNNPFQKRLAEQDARDVVGVCGVTNKLKPLVERRTDEAIRTNIELDLSADATTEKLDIQVHVKNGVVMLSGKAHSWFEKEHATDLVSRNWGVEDVVNRIRVEQSTTKQDAELLETIKTRLGRNATTSSAQSKITVNVSHGVVRLEGDVVTWAQRKEAAKIALLTDGVSAIDNRITVNGYDYPWDQWNYRPAKQPQLFDPFRTPYHLDDYFHRYR